MPNVKSGDGWGGGACRYAAVILPPACLIVALCLIGWHLIRARSAERVQVPRDPEWGEDWVAAGCGLIPEAPGDGRDGEVSPGAIVPAGGAGVAPPAGTGNST